MLYTVKSAYRLGQDWSEGNERSRQVALPVCGGRSPSYHWRLVHPKHHQEVSCVIVLWSLPISVIYHNVFIVNCCVQGCNWWRIKYRIINKHLCRGLTLVQCQLYIVFLGQIRAKCRIWSCPKIGAPKIVWQPRIFVGDYQECVIGQWSF